MITGVVLCGGNSSRMGSDKGLLQHASRIWAEVAFNKLRSLNFPVVFSINHLQTTVYKKFFSDSLLIQDDPDLHVGGPLKGILSVHRKYSQGDLLVLAVDMLNISEDLLQQLHSHSQQQDAEAIVYKHSDQIEPLCGLYKTKGLQKIMQLYEEEKLKKQSMHFILKQLQTVYIDVAAEQADAFANFNSVHDLDNFTLGFNGKDNQVG